MALDGLSALVFDVFGTLVDWRGGVAREAGPFLARHGGRADQAHDFADAWRRRYMPAMAEVREGRRPFVRLDVLHRENLLAILPEYGIDAALVAPAEIDGLNLAWHRLDPWQDVAAGLDRLRAKFLLAPLSNGNIRLMIDLARHGGLAWDAILGAEVARAYKPSPEAYLRTVETLALAPAQVCLVAAHPSDLAAARGCGLATCFVPRPLEFGAGRGTVDEDGGWDLVVPDLGALADRLGV
jgi:2-haloacid dehalogenase